MIAWYLAGELTSERFGSVVHAELARRDLPDDLVAAPDLSNEAENEHRRAILAATRGYGQDREMFTSFPEDVSWVWARLSRSELACVRYVEYSYWKELSAGSRLPIDAARRIEDGVTVFGVPNTRFFAAADALRHGAKFPPLILAGPTANDLVCLESHLRLTAYALQRFPTALDCLLGIDPRLTHWADQRPQQDRPAFPSGALATTRLGSRALSGRAMLGRWDQLGWRRCGRLPALLCARELLSCGGWMTT